MPKHSHSRSSSNEPALGSSGGSKQEDQAPAAPPSTPLWLLQAEIETVELTLTLKLPADVCGLVTAFLAKPRGLIEVLEAMIVSLKGHTHEDIDAVFRIMAGSSKDLLTWDTSMQMAERLRPIPVCRGPIEGVRGWRSWLDGLVCIQSKRGVENITEARWLAFVHRADAPLKWANFAPVPALGSTGTSPNDVKKLINLVNHHRMEIVEVTADTTYWVCATSGPKQCLGCALCSHNPIIGECSVCRRRCCRGCLEDATGQCWACLGYSSPQEEEAKMTPTTTPRGGRWEFGKQAVTVAPFAGQDQQPVPGWDNQVHLLYCPVAQPLAGQCHFERGLLFSGLGHEWDTRSVYQYYLNERLGEAAKERGPFWSSAETLLDQMGYEALSM